VLWLDRLVAAEAGTVVAAFEVEHTTSIYSGIVRMLDLALGTSTAPGAAPAALFLVAPDAREEDVRGQLARPAFSRIRDIGVRYVPYSALEQHREAMGRFGQGLRAVEAVARRLS
jgi:type II restriction enzyme